MISPTIGRIVWVTRPGPGGPASDQKEPGQICYVWHDRLINVGGFDRNGQPYGATSVVLLQDSDSPPPGGPYAEWMPYQQTAAAKAASGAS